MLQLSSTCADDRTGLIKPVRVMRPGKQIVVGFCEQLLQSYTHSVQLHPVILIVYAILQLVWVRDVVEE